jgi:hypothetical protein
MGEQLAARPWNDAQWRALSMSNTSALYIDFIVFDFVLKFTSNNTLSCSEGESSLS